MSWMAPTEYADYRAISRQIVNRYLQSGKIPATAWKLKKAGSNRKLINSRLADKALDAGEIYNRNPNGKRKREKVDKNNRKPGENVNDDIALLTIALNEKTNASDASRLERIYSALLKKQTLEKNEGQLIDADEALSTYAKVVTACKTKLLSVQSKVAPLIQDAIDDKTAAAEIIKQIDDLHREALDDLAGG